MNNELIEIFSDDMQKSDIRYISSTNCACMNKTANVKPAQHRP